MDTSSEATEALADRWSARLVTQAVDVIEARRTEQRATHTRVLDWRERLMCSQCGSRNVDMVVTGTERRMINISPGSQLRRSGKFSGRRGGTILAAPGSR